MTQKNSASPEALDNSYIHEAFEKVVMQMVSDLFWNTCNCLRDNKKKEKLLNPKYHKKTCPYKKHMEEEVQIEFRD